MANADFFKYKGRNVYYRIKGNGNPLVFLHDQLSSSQFFISETDFYSQQFTVLLFDFPGHGKSDPGSGLFTDYWFETALCTISLCEYLNIQNVNLLGTGSGSVTGLNAILERLRMFLSLIADSYMPYQDLKVFMEGHSRKKYSGTAF